MWHEFIQEESWNIIKHFKNPTINYRLLYNLMTKNNMLEEFLRISNDKVILLLNIFFLSSKERYKLLKNETPLKYIYIHSDRLTMFPYGEEKPKSTGTKMFVWMVWEHGYEGEPVTRWICKE